MIFKKRKRRKKIKTNFLLWLVIILFFLLILPVPTNSGSGLASFTNWFSSTWTKLRVEAERGADALTGVSVVGTSDEGNGLSKGGIIQPVEETVTETTEAIDMEWSFDLYPNYYLVVGSSNLDITLFPDTGQISYSDLDELGRTRVVRGSLTYENVASSYGVRQDFTADANPSGWSGNDKASIAWLNGKVYNGYFWNRSHLIADSLGGDAIRQNVITGTRTQNVGGTDQQGGMRYSEKIVQTYLEGHHDVVVYYEANPIYYGDEIVPRYVQVSFLSSDGALDQEVLVFNTANGYTIDYLTGQFFPQ